MNTIHTDITQDYSAIKLELSVFKVASNKSIDEMQKLRGRIESNIRLFSDEKFSVRREFNRRIARMKKLNDENIIRMSRMLTDEVQYLNQRMK